MPQDVLGLGVALRDLVQEFHRRHLTATLGDLETIAEKHRSAVDSMNARHPRKDRLHPASASGLRVDRLGVEEVQPPVLAVPAQPQRSNTAGHPEKVTPD
jgi:hypothetical protein